ncbi:hypothetical protein GC209_05330 [bacterium]|nr:hypothetical protein [bacterium]
MTLIRPEVVALFQRYRGSIASAACAAFGLWLMVLGGFVLVPLGLLIVGIGVTMTVLALRKARFAQEVAAPGIVELDEAQVGYFAPEVGGFLSLDELVELRILALRGRRVWRLKQADGQALLIPVDAAGSDRLFDAFANLPGMDSAALVAALQTSAIPQEGLTLAAETRVIWRKQSGSRLARS